nr:hypothetical protein [Tanacetum cinerariifolium]
MLSLGEKRVSWRVLETRSHIRMGSFDINVATRPKVGLGHLQQSRFAVPFLTDDTGIGPIGSSNGEAQ